MAKRGKKSTQTAAADPVTIQYNSNTIGTLSDSGRVTLKCADKRMLSDVEINYGVENYAPSAVTSTGDVTVTYGEETIGTLSDSGTLSFSTGGARVLHDINVNYTKSASGIPVGNTVNITNNSGVDFLLTSQGSLGELMDSNGFLKPGPYAIPVNSQLVLYAFTYSEYDSYDIVFLMLPSDEEDNYFVTVNNDPCTYAVEVDGYYYTTTSDGPVNGQTYNIVITDKE